MLRTLIILIIVYVIGTYSVTQTTYPCNVFTNERTTTFAIRSPDGTADDLQLLADRLIHVDIHGGTIDDTGRMTWRGPELWLSLVQPCDAPRPMVTVWRYRVWVPVVVN